MGARAFPEPQGDGFWVDAAPVSRPLRPPLGLPAHPARAEVASPSSYGTRCRLGGRACDFDLFLYSSCYDRDFLVALVTAVVK